MKHTWKAALAVATVAVIGTAGAAKADVTLSGQTGLFLNPTAQVAKKSAPEVAVDYQHISQDGIDGNVYGVVGAIQIVDKLELSGGYHRGSIEGIHPNNWNAGVKYQLMNQAEKGFDLAVGADYNDINNIDSDSISVKLQRYDAYVVATKGFATNSNRAPIQGTIGLRWNHNKATLSISGLGSGSVSESKVDAFAGVAVPVTRTGDFSLIGEIGSKRASLDDFGIDEGTPYSVGVRYHPTGSAFNIGAGYARGNYLAAKGFFVQAGYQFGK